MSYTPQPGTIGARVIQILQARPRGTSMSTVEINEALGQPDDYPLHPALQIVKLHGLVTAAVPPGERFTRWQLGDGTPEPTNPRDDEEDDADTAPLTPYQLTTITEMKPSSPFANASRSAHPKTARKSVVLTPEIAAQLKVETGVPVAPRISPSGGSKWAPLFDLLTTKDQSVAIPDDWATAVRAEAGKRNKTAGKNVYRVGYDPQGKTRLACIA